MINPDAIFAFDFGAPEQTYTARDAILYALGVGLGSDPLDPAQLCFLDERSLSVLPTFAVTLCTPGMWIADPALGVTFSKLVHAAQYAEFPTHLPPTATVVGGARVLSLTDRGEGKGAVLVLERVLSDKASGQRYCRLEQTLLLRGDGGFGGSPAPRNPSMQRENPPAVTADYGTSRRAALIYRLSGDWNPLHIDPAAAAKGGFERPILHGLASYGIAGVAVSNALGRDPANIARLGCRFSGVVLPGDTLTFHIWPGDDATQFAAFVGERKVLEGGDIVWRQT